MVLVTYIMSFQVKGIICVVFLTGTFIFHCKFLVLIPDKVRILDFKLSPCSECRIISFGRFSGVWIVCADVSEHSIIYIFICGVVRKKKDEESEPIELKSSCLHHLWRWNWQNVPKRRHIKFRRRGITQKKECKSSIIFKTWSMS
jgi:hypothetical protein